MSDHPNIPFTLSAHIYDDLYQKSRDYKSQAEQINEWIQERNKDATSLLDVACGTGLHLSYLSSNYEVAGIDLNPEMVEIAKHRNKNINIHSGDMRDFNIGESFDVIMCLFSSITYAGNVKGLNRTLKNFVKHSNPNGICIIEPFVTPKLWYDGGLGCKVAESKNKIVVMVDRAGRSERIIHREIVYVIAKPNSMEQIHEEYTFPLFTHKEYESAFRSAGYSVEFNNIGFNKDRGMYFGVLR